jgi:hypothetical protein
MDSMSRLALRIPLVRDARATCGVFTLDWGCGVGVLRRLADRTLLRSAMVGSIDASGVMFAHAICFVKVKGGAPCCDVRCSLSIADLSGLDRRSRDSRLKLARMLVVRAAAFSVVQLHASHPPGEGGDVRRNLEYEVFERETHARQLANLTAASHTSSHVDSPFTSARVLACLGGSAKYITSGLPACTYPLRASQ